MPLRTLLITLMMSLALAGTAKAVCPVGDLNGDCEVNLPDLNAFALQWLDGGCSGPGCADLDGAGGVEMTDFARLADNWRRAGDPLVINEFMASNGSTLQSVYYLGGQWQYEYPDWIEIRNTSGMTIDAGGMYLTDDLDVPDRWMIPASTTIAPYGYLVVFASGNGPDFIDWYGYHHTNFKLDADGEEVGLFAADGNTPIDGVVFGKQVGDVSYGRYPDGSENWRYLGDPTPGGENKGAYLGEIADTEFSRNRGFYNSQFTVTITCETPGVTIYYSVDGTEPGNTGGRFPTGIKYTGPVTIYRTTCLRARAIREGWRPSNVDTHTYIFLNDVIQQPANPSGFPLNWGHTGTGDYQMDPQVVNDPCYSGTIKDDLKAVPTLSLAMNRSDWFGSDPPGIYLQGELDERAVSAELIFPDGRPGFQINCAVMIVGGTSPDRWKMDKLSMRLKFTAEYGPTQLEFPLFGEESTDVFETLVLDARMNNTWGYGGGVLVRGTRPWISGRSVYQRDIAQYARDPFVSDIQNTMGGYGTHGRHVHLYLNGLYWGLYWVHERADEHFAAAYFGGESEDYDVLKHNSGTVIKGSGASYNQMFSIAYGGLASNAQYELIQQYLDVPNLIDYMIANFYVGNTDWAHQNWYASHSHVDPAGRWRYHSWDAEHVIEDLYEDVTGLDNSGGPTGLHQRLCQNAEYRLLFADHVHRHFFNDGVLTTDGAQALYNIRLNDVDRAVVGESARWGDNQIDKHAYIRYMRDPHWILERDWILNTYIPQRRQIVLDQLKNRGLYPALDAPSFNQHGGEVASGFKLYMNAPSEVIWYTTDGSDPRLPGGAVNNPHAVLYVQAVTLTRTTQVKARALHTGIWSALTEAVFAIGPVADNLRISEIMYHPRTTGDPNDPNHEFIELVNAGSETININLVRFTKGIDYTLPSINLAAGERVVVVKNQAAFAARYDTTGMNIAAGEYTGSLANSGERIRLEDAIGRKILDFKYSDGWRQITDGDGFSLTIIDPTAEPNSWGKKDSWRASAYVGGSPGTDDTGILPNPGAVVINEVLTSSPLGPDWIELHNTTDTAIDIGGWYLSDNDNGDANLMKYRIPGGTTVDPNGYRLFYEDLHFGNPNDPCCIRPFALSRNGEVACLSSADGNELTGYREKEDFGAAEAGVSFGRYYKSSTNNFNFVPMEYPTPREGNAYPKVGPIVIHEIMYHPDWPAGGINNNDDYEYVDLYNISDSAVTLYDYDVNEPWKFSDGIDFTFPADSGDSNAVTIAPGGYLVIAKKPAAFLWRYPGVPSDKVLGPYDGWLSNDGEKLELGKPGGVDDQGNRCYIRVDRISYSDGSHPENCPGDIDLWPTEADGLGKSLHRIVPSDYGNDVANWQAAVPSPGQ